MKSKKAAKTSLKRPLLIGAGTSALALLAALGAYALREKPYVLGKDAKYCDEATMDYRFCTIDGRLITGRVIINEGTHGNRVHSYKSENTIENGRSIHRVEYKNGVKSREYDFEGYDSYGNREKGPSFPTREGGGRPYNEKIYHANGRLKLETFDYETSDKKDGYKEETRAYDKSGRLVFSSYETELRPNDEKDAYPIRIERFYPADGPSIIGYIRNPDWLAEQTSKYMDEEYNPVSGEISHPYKHWTGDAVVSFTIKDGLIVGTKNFTSETNIIDIVYEKGKPVVETDISLTEHGSSFGSSMDCGGTISFHKTENVFKGARQKSTHFNKEGRPVFIRCNWGDGGKNVRKKDYFCAEDIPAGKTARDLCK